MAKGKSKKHSQSIKENPIQNNDESLRYNKNENINIIYDISSSRYLLLIKIAILLFIYIMYHIM